MPSVLELPLAALERLLEGEMGERPPLHLQEILSGGSVRRFFRVTLSDGRSAVAMFAPETSHEIVQATQEPRPWPFLEIRDLLASRGVRVPGLLGMACEDRWILMEDLGQTLAQHLSEHSEHREQLYRIAVRDLAHAQQALDPLPARSIVRERTFDQQLLSLELAHFREWGLEARGIELGWAERRTFERAAESLAQTISGWPRGFVHRDYQSRNLMVVRNGHGELGLGWVDFQDAMLGPRVYDIVALLNDSYQELSPDFVERRLDEYCTHKELAPSERARVGREFRLVSVQRKLKDAGRFVFFDRKQGNSSFLCFVDSSIRKAQVALDELSDDPALAELSRLLERWFPRGLPPG